MDRQYREKMKLSNQMCFPLYAAARSVTNLYTPYLNELHLTYTQYIVLLVLWENDGVTVGEICERLMLDNGTVSPLLKKLRNAGYIEKKRNASDDRVVNIYLTQEGKALQEKASEVPEKVADCLNLSQEKAELLYSLLYEVLGNNKERNTL